MPSVESRATFPGMTTPAVRLSRLWGRLRPLPGGRWLMSRAFGRAVPYSATVGATIQELEPGFCRIAVRDRRRLRNHLGSIHAVALVNLGEMTSGLAMTMAMPPGVRGIVTSLAASFPKKARGALVAEARVTVPEVGGDPIDHQVETSIRDAAGDVVCSVKTRWRLART